MSLKIKLIIYLNGIIFIAVLFSFLLAFFEAKKNLEEEITSSVELANFAITEIIKNTKDIKSIDDVKFLKELNNFKKLHHLKLEALDIHGKIIGESSDKLNPNIQPPKWFKNIFTINEKNENFFRIVNISNKNSTIGSVVIQSNLDYDHEVLWVELLTFVQVVIFMLIFLNLSVIALFSQTLQPIKNIINALDSLSVGNFKINLKKINILEFENIRYHTSNLIKILEKNTSEINELNQKLLETQEKEKISISHDLHDHLAQDLSSIQIKSKFGQLTKSVKEKNKIFDEVIVISQGINDFVRSLIKKMNLSFIDEIGFIQATENLIQDSINSLKVKKFNKKYQLEIIQDRFQTDLYRILQESFSNMKKHSLPREVTLDIFENKNDIIVKIKNDGVIGKKKGTKGIGLIGIRQRVQKFDGSFKSKIFKNTFTIDIKIPKKNLG
ncbi:histidine kinase [Methylophilaceae bacterium]|nr:histidine kinase [Methylophilaceae bacterium]